MPNQSRCLVTGGAGFIGSHLVDRLRADDHSVTIIDDFACGRPENVTQHDNDPDVTVHRMDVNDLPGHPELLTDIDQVFHLAALADIVPSVQEPQRYHHANVDGTLAVLEACRRADVARLVYAASSSCYGIPDQYPTPETAPIRPEYPYAFTKWVGESYAHHWHHVYGLPVVSLRLFNAYGPRSRTNGTYGAVFGVFLAQKLAGKPYTVVGDGTQTRDFTYVTDIVDGFVRAANAPPARVAGEAINLGSGGTYSINHLVDLIGGDKVHIPKRPGEPDQTYADITKAHELLDWEPRVSFEDGVAMMLDHIDHWQNAPVWEPATIATATQDWFAHLGRNA